MAELQPTDHESEDHRRRLLRLGPPVVIVVLGALVYAGTLNVPFIFDDYNAIVENPHIRSLWPPTTVLTAPDQSTVAGRPVASLTLALNHAVSGLEPWSYHLFNIAIHIVTGLLLFIVIRRTLESSRIAAVISSAPDDVGQVPATGWALALALVWLVHPLNTEVVTYVSTRTEGLVGLLYLVALYAAIRGATAPEGGSPWNLIAVIACALAMATKEVAAALPLLVLLFDGVFLSDGFSDAWRRRRAMYVGMAATWLILLALVAGGARSETVGVGFDFLTPLDYLRTQVGVVWHYLRLAVWPWPLVLDYSDWPVARDLSPAVALGGLTLLGLAAGSAWMVLRRSWVGFLGCWFFLILAPSSSLIPITSEMAAERRLYLPLMAVVALAMAGLWRLAGRAVAANRRSLAVTAIVVPIIAALGWLTVDRNRVYTDEVEIWRDTVRKRPANLRAIENLGAALVSHDRRGEAVSYLEQALRMNPDSHRALGNLGLIRLDESRIEEALELLTRSAELQPDDGLSRINLAKAQVATGNWEGAAATLEEGLRLLPGSAVGHARLALVLAELGRLGEAGESVDRSLQLDPDNPQVLLAAAKIHLLRGDLDGAAAHYRSVLSSDPDNVEGLLGLAATSVRSGNLEDSEPLFDRVLGSDPDPQRIVDLAAIAGAAVDQEAAAAVMDAAVRRWPDSAELHLARGRLLAASGRDAEALDAYRVALRLRPRWADAGNSLALLWATAGDAAVRDSERAVKLAFELSSAGGHRHPVLLSTLGIALASDGRRPEGEDALARALALAERDGQPALAEELRRQLELVRQGWPPPAS